MSYRQGYKPQNRQTAQRAPAQRGSTAKRGKRRTKRKGHPFRVFLLLVLLASLATGGVMVYMMYEEVGRVEREHTFYPGIYIDGISLHGATPQEAYDYLIGRARADLQSWSITLSYEGQKWTITPDTLGLGGAMESVVSDEVNKAFYIGRTGSMVDRYKTILALKNEPYTAYTTGIEKNMSAIDSMISEIQAHVYRAPQDATRAFNPNLRNPIVITDEVVGRELDAAALKEQINGMVNSMQSGNIDVQPTPIVPSITRASLEGEIVLIGSCESVISTSSTPDRNKNIERGCEAFHGKVIQPGERVSFNNYTGKRTEKNGFFWADEIVSGQYEPGIGGGICQVSSTLYNAVIKANLRVRERRNHGLPVRYMEMGADATVSDNGKDFVFENNTDAPIYLIARMETSNNGKRKTCVVQIYGRPEPNNYTYELAHETLSELPIPEPTYVKDRDQTYVTYKDQEHIVSKGAIGYVVRTYLVVRDQNGSEISRKELYTDTYSAQKPIIYVGVTSRE